MIDLIFGGVVGLIVLAFVCTVLGIIVSVLWLRIFWKRWKETNQRIENARRGI